MKAWRWALAALVTWLIPGPASAYSTMACPSNPAYRYAYPNDAVWPIDFFVNMPPGDGWRAETESAMATWNAVYGAWDELAYLEGDGYLYCQPPEDAGFGVIGWDDGSCFDWGQGYDGVQIFWERSCTVVRSVVYFNMAHATTYEWLRHVAIHELGHYQYYDHNWYEISNMGYTWSTTPPMTFLTAADQGYLRLVFPSGNVAPPDLHIHRFKLLDTPQPGKVSYEEAPPPSCSGGCYALTRDASIEATLSFGNTGAAPTSKPVKIRMYLGATPIGEWETVGVMPAHSEGTATFVGFVPSGVPMGNHELQVWIDPDDEIEEYPGPSAANHIAFQGFFLPAPSDWLCDPFSFGAGDACDCECGVPDPDCAIGGLQVTGCPETDSPCLAPACDAGGSCGVHPREGECDDGLFCTVGDQCAGGECVGLPRDCSYLADACDTGRCDEASSSCVSEPRPGAGGCGGSGTGGAPETGGSAQGGAGTGGQDEKDTSCACRAGKSDRSPGSLTISLGLGGAALILLRRRRRGRGRHETTSGPGHERSVRHAATCDAYHPPRSRLRDAHLGCCAGLSARGVSVLRRR